VAEVRKIIRAAESVGQTDGANGTARESRLPGAAGLARRLFWSGAALIVLCAVMSAAAALIADARLRERQEAAMAQYWDAFLADQFRMRQSWPAVAEAAREQADVLRLAMGGDLALAIWNERGEPVFSSGRGGAGERRSIVHEGRVVGTFAVRYAPEPGVSETFLGAMAAVAAAGVAAMAVWARAARRAEARFRHDLAARLDAMLNGETVSGRPAAAGAQRAPMPFDPPLETRLGQVERRLRQLERMRKTMIADIAHELRTPLATVRARLENALAGAQPVPPETLAVMHDELGRMSKLVHDLNQLALAESGHLPLSKSWFPLRELLDRLVEAIRPAAEEAGVTLELDGPEAPLLVYADRTRMQQVFLNLLDNAVRYARSRIVVRCRADELQVRVAVRDDGPGMEEEELARVFDRFHRGDRRSARAGRAPGLGLGLAIVKEVVAAHGGEVTAESRWNEGTVFTVALPVFRE
jgi:signal transduction histidine kinase